jgi:uncharacterized protein (DUF849 family)
MIVQACLNGARAESYHPALPITVEAMARDGAACVAAGAAELHFHPRAPDGRESLSPATMDAAMLAMRKACPGTLVGVSTGAWIERDEKRTRDSIGAWSELPDYASVNLSERDAPAVMELLSQRGVGIEAGLASVADAERLARLGGGHRILRVLIEISEQNPGDASGVADDIAAVLRRAELRKPILLHGFDEVWQFVTLAAAQRWSTRVGLEDGCMLPDRTLAAGNAELVSAAVQIFRSPARQA